MAVQPAFLARTLDRGTDVKLQANTDLSVDSALVVDNPDGSGGALSLHAGRSILVNADIETDGGALSLWANEDLVYGAVDDERDAGPAQLRFAEGGTVDTAGAMLVLGMDPGAGQTHAETGTITFDALTAGNVVISSAGAVHASGPISASGWVSLYSQGPLLIDADADIVAPDGFYLGGGSTVTASGDITTSDAIVQALYVPITLAGDVSIDAGSGGIELALLDVVGFTASLTGSAVTLLDGLALAGGTVGATSGVVIGDVESGLLTGYGVVDGPVTIAAGATVSPGGSGVGTLAVGSLTMTAGAAIDIDVETVDGSDQMAVTGTLDLGNATLTLRGLTDPGTEPVVIIDNDGSDAVVRTFADFGESAGIDVNAHTLRITYLGGD